MEKKIEEIAETLIKIELDLKYHIARTDELQEMVTPTYKVYIFGSYLLKALVPITLAIGLWFKLK